MRNLVVWVVLGSLMFYVFNYIESGSPSQEIEFSELRKEALGDNVKEVTFKGDRETMTGTYLDGTKFYTQYHKDDNFAEVQNILKDNNVPYSYEKVEQPSIFSQLLIGAFPIILLFFTFFFRLSS